MTSGSASRRDFLKTAAVAGTMAALPNAHAAGSDVLRVGLVGCGDRGTGAATQALAADSNVQLVAMADAFEDRLQNSLEILQKTETISAKVAVKPDRRFVGFNAYQELLGSGVDVVLLCTPPHFRPIHLRAAVEAGKHVFAEKPVAVDAPGVHSVLESCKLARSKGLSVVSGLCLRYDNGFRKPSVASTTAPSATSPPCSPTTIEAAVGTSRASPAGPTCCTRCGTGTTSPGCRATSTSSSTSTTSTSAPG